MTELEAVQALEETPPISDRATCTFIRECKGQAIRLAIFHDLNNNYRLEYLCERHKQMGQW